MNKLANWSVTVLFTMCGFICSQSTGGLVGLAVFNEKTASLFLEFFADT